MKNINSFTKQEFLQLRITHCPFCESEDTVQWYDEKTNIKHFSCNNCDFHSEEQFIEINWADKDDRQKILFFR